MGETGKQRAGQAAACMRREVVYFAGTVALGGVLPSLAVRPAAATPTTMKSAIAAVMGEATLNAGRVKLEIPPLVENGNTVACAVTVASPMSASDYVKAIHISNEKNPQPNVISVKVGPRPGRPRIPTRMRISDTQPMTATAARSDVSLWSHSVDVLITVGACLEDPL